MKTKKLDLEIDTIKFKFLNNSWRKSFMISLKEKKV
jgi:hypothetical protein